MSGWADLSAQNGFEIIAVGAEGGAHGGTRPATAAILNEIGGTRISRSQVCRLVTDGDLPKRRQVGKVAHSKRAIRVHVARITVDGSMIQPDARATWVIGGTGNLGGNS